MIIKCEPKNWKQLKKCSNTSSVENHYSYLMMRPERVELFDLKINSISQFWVFD